MKILYVPKRFTAKRAWMIETANQIIEEYQRQGFVLTLRQLYYQFVARGLVANDQHNYDKLGVTISEARLAGLVDWEAILEAAENMD